MIRSGFRRIAFLQSEIASVHAAALILGGAGLLSRALGVVRDRMLAARFGAGRELDIYAAAFNIPDFMSVLFLLGGASAAILPVFQEHLARDREKAREFISALSTLFLTGATVVSVAAFFASGLIMPVIVPGFTLDEQAMTATLARLMLLSPILLGLSSIFSVVVQSFQRFYVYAAAPLFYNLGIIAGILFLVPRFGVIGIAGGVVAGALLHMSLQAYAIASLGFEPRFFRTLAHMRELASSFGGDIRRVALIAAPRVLAVSLAHLTLLMLHAIGSTLAAGSVAILSFAQNLYFVPVGVFGVSYAIAIFPRLARAAAARHGEDFSRELADGIRSILFWAAPSAALFIVLRAHVVRVALGAGAFSWEDTRLTAAVLAALSVAIVAGALQTLLIRAFYALGNTWIPLAVNAAASLFSITLAFFLTQALGASSPFSRMLVTLFRIGDLARPEVLGLGMGFAVGMLIDVGVLYFVLMAYTGRILGRARTALAPDAAKIVAASIAAGVAAYAVRVSFSGALPLVTFVRVLTQGAISATAGFAAYFGILTLMGSEDVVMLRRVVARRLFSLRLLPKYWDGSEVK